MGKIFNISAAEPFLEALAACVLEKFPQPEKVTIYLPSKRAIRTLSELFLKLSGKPAMLLPNMQAVGDIDDDELEFSPKYAALAELDPPISKPKRLIEMAKLLAGEGRNFVQSTLLAKSLLQLVDEVQNRDADFTVFENIIPEELAQHWQITLDFLKIAGVVWREKLQEEKLLEPVERRNLILNSLADYYTANPPQDPVVIAGTTGSVHATANLVKAIYGSDNGHVVLFGLDEFLSDEDLNLLEETHPQKMLANLLRLLGCHKDDVENLHKGKSGARSKLISTALLPTHKIEAWQGINLENDIEAFEAANIEEEALAVAIALREALEQKDKTAMVVTTNRQLARRIAAKMKIWDVGINDSAGQPLLTTVSANFLVLLADMVAGKYAPIDVLGFFKHPFIAPDIKARIRELEIKKFHGPRLEELPPLPAEFDDAKFKQMFEEHSVRMLDIINEHMQLAESVAPALWEKEGTEVKLFLDEFKAELDAGFEIDPVLYPELLRQILLTKTYRPKYGQHPRVSILSPIEARLQSADLVIISGMNEGSFPQLPPADSFMNQNIRRQAGLDLLEKRIGQAAHDFELLSHAPKILLTRSQKEGGSPAQKSRFWQRLEAISKLNDASRYIDWAKQINEPEKIKAFERPMPKPPASARPKELSATKIGKLLRDPYTIYAEKVLGLYKLDEIDRELSAADFGNFVHKALEEFSRNYDGKLETLVNYGKEAFRPFENYIGARSFWWGKFLRIAAKFIELEAERRQGQKIFIEQKRELKVGGFTIKAIADRVEVDGGLKLIDYKTGRVPDKKDIERGLEPQMPIEAMIFEKEYNVTTTALEYWHLKGVDEVIEIKSIDLAQIEATRQSLPYIIEKLTDPATPFVARPWSYYALKYNDYEHLERIKEWAE